MQIRLEKVRDDWQACYDADRLASLFDRPHTPLEVLTRNDGSWAEVPPQDRLWVVLREECIDARTLRLFAVWCARQALALIDNPDPRSVAACDVAERYANGKASKHELAAAAAAALAAARDAALAAARDAAGAAALAAARDAAWAAARYAAGDAARDAAAAAALAAARGAAWAAARAAAGDAQLQQLIAMLESQ